MGMILSSEINSQPTLETRSASSINELRRSIIAPLLILMYRCLNAQRRWRIARFLIQVALRLEGGAMRSATARQMMSQFHGVSIGAHSYGEIFDPAIVPPGVELGRYVSVARGARMIVQNHPLDRLSTHPYFYEAEPGVAASADIPPGRLQVGNDVWIGCNAVICPGCRSIGNGSVIGAGSIVTRDVPAYSIVAGNPARVIRQRFSETDQAFLEKTNWSQQPFRELPQELRHWKSGQQLLPEKDLSHIVAEDQRSCQATASVIIPAHNEATVIERCLDRLTQGSGPGEIEIIVACNGCTDDTAARARAFDPSIIVLEIEEASKIAALNRGDQAASHFPRLYVDADVSVSIGAIRKTANLLSDSPIMTAAPRIEWVLSQCSLPVRAFYSVWRHQPYFDGGQVGAGFYGLSEMGHCRIGKFPQLTADDEFVRRSFRREERQTIENATFKVTPPQRLRDLIRIKTRSRRGTWELLERFPELATERNSRLEFARRVFLRPQLWPAAVIYAYVCITTSLHARRTLRLAQPPAWERDLSSRAEVGAVKVSLSRHEFSE